MLLENNPYPQDVRVRSEAQSLVGAGHTVEVIAPRLNGQPAKECVDGVTVRRYRATDATSRGLTALLLEYAVAMVALHAGAIRALARGATVLHIHNPPDTLFLAGGIYRLAGRRVVFDHHDLSPELVAVKFGKPALIALARIAERLTFSVATHVLAANESHAAVARKRGHKQPTQVTVVRNGPPASWTRLPSSVRPGRLSPVRLAYVGAISQQDGVEALADILVLLRDRTPSLPALLTVIGDGDGRPGLEAALRRLGVADAVTLTGWVEGGLVPGLLQNADVCVDPAPGTALNERSTMIKLAEYLALGKPVVAFDLLETRRTVAGAALLAPAGDTGAFADRIAKLAEDPELRLELAQRGRARAAELTWEHSQAALLRAYAGFGADVATNRSSAMRLSVIIVTHNSAGVLEACWRSVRSFMPGAEIIVVDNASTDDTQRLCEELGGVKLIANPVNVGYGRACNQGAQSAVGSHLMFLNPDVELSHVDSRALETEGATTPFGLVGPVIKHGRHAAQHWSLDLLGHVTGPLRPRELPAFPRPIPRGRRWWPAGALLLVDRQEFTRLGGFDRRFFLYYEDLDLARRYRAAGLPVRITPSVHARHRQGSSSGDRGSGGAVRQGWSYISWIEYLCIWYGPDTARRAAGHARSLRSPVNRALQLLEHGGPLSRRAVRKRQELTEIDSFVAWQCSRQPDVAEEDFCPRAREILAAL